MRKILWQTDAWSEYLELQNNKALLHKINKLLQDIQRNGYDCSYGKPEMLKGHFKGYASVRIDRKNRIVFRVTDEMVIVLKCCGHYDE